MTIDLTDRRFGTLTANTPSTYKNKRSWLCICDCGNVKNVLTFQLTSGCVVTCGADLHRQSIKIGDRFGKLVVQSIYRDDKNGRFMASCLCDCGNVKPNASFKNLGRGSTLHCGCTRDYSKYGLDEGVSIRKFLIGSFKRNAKTRKLSFELSDEECLQLFNGNCYLCGLPPSDICNRKGLKGSGNYLYSSIDRIDSEKGYTIDNVASCCRACNYLKSNRKNQDFLSHIERIYKHQHKNA